MSIFSKLFGTKEEKLRGKLHYHKYGNDKQHARMYENTKGVYRIASQPDEVTCKLCLRSLAQHGD